MELLIPEPSIQLFCKTSLKLILFYAIAYLISIIAHLPACWLLVHDFSEQAKTVAQSLQSIGKLPFYTIEDLNLVEKILKERTADD